MIVFLINIKNKRTFEGEFISVGLQKKILAKFELPCKYCINT